MSIELNGNRIFTKEMTNVFQAEVIECPDCGFEFASKHIQEDKHGCYECPCCNEANLEAENYHLIEKIERYKFVLSKLMNTQCFMSNGKMQYTTTGQIAKRALED